MSAKLEIILYQQGVINIEKIINFSKKYGLVINFNKIEYMENWQYEKHRTNKIDNKTIINNRDKIFEDKITIIRGEINNSIECGLHFEKENNNKYDICGWFDILKYNQLDKNIIIEDNRKIYDLITENILECMNDNEWYFCGIGVETYIKKNEDIKKLLNESTGVCRWIFPDKPDVLIAKYEIKEKYNTFIFDKIK